MLKIRLQRIGRKHEPVFRVVLTDSQNGPKSGKFKEILGSYDARRGEQAVLDSERIKFWISKGAQTSGTVHNMLVEKKAVQAKKINVLPKKKPIVKESETKKEASKAEVEQAEQPAKGEEAPTETPAEAPTAEAPASEENEVPQTSKKEEPKDEPLKEEKMENVSESKD